MKQIVRVEYTDGNGIFWAADEKKNDIVTWENFENLLDRHGSFPTPYTDKLLKGDISEEDFCAFKTIAQLQEWVTEEELKSLASLGFKILLLDVSEAKTGEYQILYKKKNILQTKDITQLFI